MSDEKEQEHPAIVAFDKLVSATADYLRAIFPTLFKIIEKKD